MGKLQLNIPQDIGHSQLLWNLGSANSIWHRLCEVETANFMIHPTLHIRSGQGCVALAGTMCSRLLDVVVGQLLILIGLTCIAFIAKRLQV